MLPTVSLIFLVCLIGTANGIHCYNCPVGCPDPFNKTNVNAHRLKSSSGWCMKFKESHEHISIVIRSPDAFGLCRKNKCVSAHHNGAVGTRCCCNTELCNNSNTVAIPLKNLIGLAFLIGINSVLNY